MVRAKRHRAARPERLATLEQHHAIEEVQGCGNRDHGCLGDHVWPGPGGGVSLRPRSFLSSAHPPIAAPPMITQRNLPSDLNRPALAAAAAAPPTTSAARPYSAILSPDLNSAYFSPGTKS